MPKNVVVKQNFFSSLGVLGAALAACLTLAPTTARADVDSNAGNAETSSDGVATTDNAGTFPAAEQPAARPSVQAATPMPGNTRPANRAVTGGGAWLLAGLAGAMVPLLFFALPLIWLVWLPGVGPLALMGAAVWAGLMGLVGGGVVWGLLSLFSQVRSGFVIPILISGAVTLGLVFGAGILAAILLVTGFIGGTFLGGWYMFGYRPPWQRNESTTAGTTMWWGTASAAFVVWALGAVVASVAGPLAAASAFLGGGVASDNKVHVDPVTP